MSDARQDFIQGRLAMDQAHRAVMLEDARDMLAHNRAALRRGVAEASPTIGGRAPAEQTLGNIHVGDSFQTTSPPAALSSLAKLGIAAALIGSGASIPLGLYGVLQALKPMPAPQQPFDQDTQFELLLPMEE